MVEKNRQTQTQHNEVKRLFKKKFLVNRKQQEAATVEYSNKIVSFGSGNLGKCIFVCLTSTNEEAAAGPDLC